ncbi:MAG: PhoH family protein [Bacteroidales bacterium]|nr:PhoH family protein [Bacteroidales bacterium]
MEEKIFNIKHINQTEFFGVGEKNLKFITLLYPMLTMTVRAENLTIHGTEKEIQSFTKFFERLMKVYRKEHILDENLIMSAYKDEDLQNNENNILLYGNKGLAIKARTINQQKMVEEIEKNDMLFAIGPAGSGKTYTAVALAVKYLREKRVKRIILTRPAVEAGENLGFLPGDMKEKLDPYLQPLYDALRDMLGEGKLNDYIEHHIIEIAPLAFMRGRTLENSFAILDEAQNATIGQIKMFLTRMGNYSKFIITGDPTQTDLPNKQPSGLIPVTEKLKNIKGIAIVELTNKDIVRNPLVTRILEVL